MSAPRSGGTGAASRHLPCPGCPAAARRFSQLSLWGWAASPLLMFPVPHCFPGRGLPPIRPASALLILLVSSQTTPPGPAAGSWPAPPALWPPRPPPLSFLLLPRGFMFHVPFTALNSILASFPLCKVCVTLLVNPLAAGGWEWTILVSSCPIPCGAWLSAPRMVGEGACRLGQVSSPQHRELRYRPAFPCWHVQRPSSVYVAGTQLTCACARWPVCCPVGKMGVQPTGYMWGRQAALPTLFLCAVRVPLLLGAPVKSLILPQTSRVFPDRSLNPSNSLVPGVWS